MTNQNGKYKYHITAYLNDMCEVKIIKEVQFADSKKEAEEKAKEKFGEDYTVVVESESKVRSSFYGYRKPSFRSIYK